MFLHRHEWKANIHFKDDNHVAKADTVKYLGGTITSTTSRNTEMSSRMSTTLGTSKQLQVFWRKTHEAIGWTVQVYNAIIISQLIYGINTLNTTPEIKDILNAFHMCDLRYILDIDHRYNSHMSNKAVINRMSLAINDTTTLNLT